MKEYDFAERGTLTLDEYGVIVIEDMELLELVSGGAAAPAPSPAQGAPSGGGSGSGNNICNNTIVNFICFGTKSPGSQ